MKAVAMFGALALAAACHHPAPPAAGDHPKLVVLIVIDQLPEWAFARKVPAFHDGFARLLREGEWRVGEHPSAATLTAPGHTLLGTGATPSQSGILANEWWHRDVGRPLKSVEDVDGKITTRWLHAPGIGEAVLGAGAGGKAVAISLKDRAAILPLGHAGVPIWYDSKQAAFVSETAVPWLTAWNIAHPVSAHLHDEWTLGIADAATLTGVSDDAPGEIGEKGFGPTFPHRLADTANPADAIFATPLGNQLVLELAAGALAGAQLGTDASPDVLILSLSAHDYVGHGWGQESWEMWDLELKLDAQLGTFMTALDAQVGAGQWAMIVTSDHGASPMPDGNAGGRLSIDALRTQANAAAVTVLGAGDWVADARYPSIYLTAAALAQPAERRAAAIAAIVAALKATPGIGFAAARETVAGHCDTRTGDDRVICLALDPVESGEVIYIPAPHWVTMDESEHVATAHGSIHDYDRQVPLIVMPPHRTPHAAQTAPTPGMVSTARVAPTLAKWLGVPAPAMATEAPL